MISLKFICCEVIWGFQDKDHILSLPQTGGHTILLYILKQYSISLTIFDTDGQIHQGLSVM